MNNALSTALADVITFVPKLIFFFIILIIGWIIAKLIEKALSKVLQKVGFDKAVERGGIKKALEKSKFDASSIVGKIVYYFILLFVLELAFGVFGPNPISTLLTGIIAYLPLVFVAIIIIVITFAIAAAVRELIVNMLGGLSYGKMLANVASAFIIFLGVIAALNQMQIAVTVTTPILIAVLAIVAGVVIVGAGGGLIKPMQARWESYLSKAEEEAPQIKEQAKNAPSVKDQAQQAKNKAQHSQHSGNNKGAHRI
ncbi:mechanosensitive ion channel family protein [Arthrobacter sp. H14-L1]|uniref:mechanosensitive ion channel family protein n=1 Tax=Arthrobacter sp. H14-L1 TaxID=2996697 RepID=UPI0022711396|nr:hypothetical protein [Arthrobacter sp. H14-L1]MCY0905518.1 hypothetical protein [Arthrobacter sp. H14-L1]